MPNPSVAIIGSLNIDFVIRTPRLPSAGETLPATSFDKGFGGKGANQAVACARLSRGRGTRAIDTLMIGQVGDDDHGREIYEHLRDAEGIDVKGLRRLEGKRTGVTDIIVEEGTGENRILFVAEANGEFGGEGDEGWELMPEREGVGVVVFQMEIPLGVVLHNMRKARQSDVHVILNPSPAQTIPESSYADIDTLIMNETEAEILSSSSSSSSSSNSNQPSTQEMLTLAQTFLDKGVRKAVIITLGKAGLVYVTSRGEKGEVPALKVEAVDTTAAGDTFVGAYAAELARQETGKEEEDGLDFRKAMEFATLASSKAVQRRGAMASIPRGNEL